MCPYSRFFKNKITNFSYNWTVKIPTMLSALSFSAFSSFRPIPINPLLGLFNPLSSKKRGHKSFNPPAEIKITFYGLHDKDNFTQYF